MSANFYSVGDVSKLVGVTIKTLRLWDRDGKYPARRTVGGDRIYTDEDLVPLKELSAAVTSRPKNPFRGKRKK
jgi:DNA-binding transcriptional MerR regulator